LKKKLEEVLIKRLEDDLSDIRECINQGEYEYVVFTIESLTEELGGEYVITEEYIDDLDSFLPKGFYLHGDLIKYRFQ